jgi:CCR4-NOT transcriptional complex subunit CAF120
MMEGDKFREPESTLQKGKLEGWAKVRIGGSTEWQRLWVIISTSSLSGSIDGGRSASPDGSVRKNRLSGFLGGSKSSSVSGHGPVWNPVISMYPGNKSKDKKKLLYTTTRVTQAFAVYPERPEVINASSLFKIEGTIKDEQVRLFYTAMYVYLCL